MFEHTFEHMVPALRVGAGRISFAAVRSSTPVPWWGATGRGDVGKRRLVPVPPLPVFPRQHIDVTAVRGEVCAVTRLYGDAVDDAAEVRRLADEPEQFLWRDRLYLVRVVQGHWMESGGWWRTGVTRAALSGEPDAGAGAGAGPAGGVLDDGEREFWRVEAGAGRLADTGVFDLCFDWSHGRWTVVRVQD